MTSGEIQTKINEIDDRLLPLLAARLDCGREVVAAKQKSGGPVLNPDHERETLDRTESRAGECGREARVIYAARMEANRSLQHRLFGSGEDPRAPIQSVRDRLSSGGRIACQGAEGAYSYQAAPRLFPKGELSFSHVFDDVLEALRQGTVGFGILPAENSSVGSVTEVYDLILKYRLFIAAAATAKTDHCLAVPKGTRHEELRTVYSHPQTPAQCLGYLNNNGLSAEPLSNTVVAAKMAAQQDGSTGVIYSQQAAGTYDLTILDHDIQSSHNNCTRFVVVCRGPIIPLNAQKISLCFFPPHTTGSLSGILSHFAIHSLSLTKIKSRSLADKNFEYDFYLGLSGNVHEADTLNLIAVLYEELPRFSFLGNYRELGVAP